jgi:hypothetical protein
MTDNELLDYYIMKRLGTKEEIWNHVTSQNPEKIYRGPGGLGYLIIPTMEEWERRLDQKRKRKDAAPKPK